MSTGALPAMINLARKIIVALTCFHPIMMTSPVMVLAMLPTAFAIGQGF
jgi:multidrug efflux pump subunit AcrB